MVTCPQPLCRRPIWVMVLAALFLMATDPTALAERPPAPRLLPDTTLALVCVTDAPDMAERFMNTSMGKMSQDPQLKPLIGQLYGSITEVTAELKERIGLSLPELLAIPQGELTLALVAPEDTLPAVVLLLDVGNHLSDARKLLRRGTEALERANVAKSEKTIAGTKLVIYDGVGPGGRKAAYFEKDATIVVGSDPNVLEQLLAVWNGGKGPTLAENKNFAAVMRRCRDASGQPPQIAWYADPIGIMHAVSEESTGARVALAMLPALGLDGLSAVGGTMFWDVGQFDSVAHFHVLLESPRSGVIKMIAFESGDVTPERWVPPDVAGYMTLHWDVQQTYESLEKLYDSFRGEGAFGKALERRFLGPTGIDVKKDIVESLDGRISVINWFERPARMQSQLFLIGLKLRESEPIEKALRKVAELSRGGLAEKTYAGETYYAVQMPGVENMPPEQRPPRPCFGVVDDSLLLATGPALLEKAIATGSKGADSLADELDFKLIASKIRRQTGGAEPAMIAFSRPEEAIRFVYELVNAERTRRALQRQAENNPFFRRVDRALRKNPLPPFSVLQQYLAPGGGLLVDDQTGIHYTAFGLRRNTD